MKAEGEDVWRSTPLELAFNENKVILVINHVKRSFELKIKLGVEEDDLF